ncbi:pyruvate kinase, partial [Staphylococcus hominis]
AAGQYPEEAVKTMRNIAISAEAAQDYKKLLSDRTKLVETSLVNAIGVSVAHTALNLNVKAIVAATESGSTAITISKYRPHSDIIAVTPSEHTARQLALVWGAYPVVKKGRKTTDDLLNNAVATAVATEKVGNGDLIIITAGVPTGEKGTTNMMKLHLVGDEIAKGQGVGRGSTTGKTVISKTASDLEGKDLSESIIVTNSVDESYVPYVEKAAGLITEENGITSPSAIVGLEQGIPTIIGVENATKELKNDLLITVDANQGRIFEGYANVL